MSGEPVKPPATKNWPAAVEFVTQALHIFLRVITSVKSALFPCVTVVLDSIATLS
jgi:hypothetical protein